MVFKDRTYTSSEYETIAAQYPNRRFELIHGEIIEKMPTQLHAYVIYALTLAIGIFLKKHPIGYALPEARYRIPGDDHNDRIPGLSFITKARGPLVAQGPAPYMPDLAVEVQSPGQSDQFMADKAAYYLKNDTRMVWLIYPDRQLAEVLKPGERHLLTADGTLDGGEVLPGFQVALADLFPNETESSAE